LIYPDKAKPFVSKGRKATGLIFRKTAVLPKDNIFGLRGFFYLKLFKRINHSAHRGKAGRRKGAN
jgi:hypothetical protein